MSLEVVSPLPDKKGNRPDIGALAEASVESARRIVSRTRLMTTLELTLQLPDELAQRAQSAGLLTSAAIERVVRDAIRKGAARQLIEIGKELRTTLPPISTDELEAELQAVRAELRESRARGSWYQFGGFGAALGRYAGAPDRSRRRRNNPDIHVASADHVLACALAANADLIVSGDAHLLNLKSYQRIPIVNAAEALGRIAKAGAPR